jgi:hypothetical protein
MEILALLLLGLIAMLAIVPPLIRGKLMQSPLATSQSFQRSMQEMANSIEPLNRQDEGSMHEAGAAHAPGVAHATGVAHVPATAKMAIHTQTHPLTARSSHRSKAAIRRNRIVTALSLFASIWGVATLISGVAWCLVIFAIACGLLVIYWALSMTLPYISFPSRAERRPEESSRPPESQAM